MASKPVYAQYALTVGTGAGAQKYALRLNKNVYGATGVSEILGIKAVSSDDNFNGVGGLADLRRAGVVSKIRATGKSADNKTRSFRMWCVTAKVPNAVAQLPTKTIDGVNISSAGLPLTTRFR
jgi:hypothetical protein